MKHLSSSALCALLAFTLTLNFFVKLDGATQPNVVIFYADDFGWGDMRLHNTDPGAYRYTPHMDRMFTEGIEFSNYMTHCVCSPSRAGLLTGKHYSNVDQGPVTGGTMDHNIRNFAKDFQDAGYVTGVFGKWHNSKPNFPEDGNGAEVDFNAAKVYSEVHQTDTMDLTNNIFEKHKGYAWGVGVNAYGFDRFVGFYAGGGDHFDHYDNWHGDADWWHDRKYRADELGYRTDLITQHSIQFIENNKNSPFLCYVPQLATHNPIQLLLSDLQEYCNLLEAELGITGQWDYVKNIQSPTSGNLIQDVQQLRFDKNREFDLEVIDPNKTHFQPLIYGAYCYTMDKSIGAIIQKVTDIGEFNNTVFLFAADNGGTSNGINLPFSGGKHSLWEGGTHVPAAIWWPGTFDSNTAPYSPGDNKYTGLISYIDMYPTLMSVTQQPLQGTNLDGLDCWSHLQNRTECRPDSLNDAIYMSWDNHGAIRTDRWKLFYSESDNRVELYDLDADIAELTNVASANPSIRDSLIGLYKDWLTDNSFTLPYVTIDPSDILYSSPAPSGEVLEVRATQTANISDRDKGGVAIRFSRGRDEWDETLLHLGGGDRLEYDIYVHPDSEVTKGCFYSPGKGWNPVYKSNNGLNQHGVLLNDLDLPKGVWTRQVVGIGSMSPSGITVNHIILNSPVAGNYHYYLDNIVIRKKDGTIRNVIWQSGSDFINLLYRYKNKNYTTLDAAQAISGFAFSDIQVSAVDAGPYPISKPDSFIDRTDESGATVSDENNDSAANEGPVQLFDNDVTTKYLTNNSSSRLQYQFGGGKKYTIQWYTVRSAVDAPNGPPQNMVLNGSFESGGLSPDNWTLSNTGLATGSTDASSVGGSSLKLSSDTVIQITPTKQTIALEQNTDYEIKFWALASGITAGQAVFDTADKFDPSSPTGPGGDGQVIVKAADAPVWTEFSGSFNSATETSVTLRIFTNASFSGTVFFDNVSLIAPSSSMSAEPLDPASWTLSGSNDGSNWTLIDSQSGVSFSYGGQKLEFSAMDNATAYSHYQMDVTSNGGSMLQFSELELWGDSTEVSDPLEDWKNLHGITDLNADDDGDGILNLMEYALGGNPITADASEVETPEVTKNSQDFLFQFRRKESGVTYIIETSSDLQSWSDHITINDSHGTVGELATVPVSLSSMTNGKLFLRLKVEN